MQLKLISNMPTDKEVNSAENISTGALLLKFWPIVAAAAFGLLSIGGIYVKVDYIAKSIERNDLMFANMNDRQNGQGNSIVELRTQVANIAESNARNGQAIVEVNNKLERVIDKQRWTPK